MDSSVKPIGILGGTFDPFHNGHLKIAQIAYETLALEKVLLIPCAVPAHKPRPVASAEQRLAMLKLVAQDYSFIQVDQRELKRPGPSYMVETLESLRHEYPERSFVLILGSDAFNLLPTWHRWQELLRLCHLVVVQRPENHIKATPALEKFLELHKTADRTELHHLTAGKFYRLQNSLIDISSTAIREDLAKGLHRSVLLPDKVLAYILRHHLYTNK